MCRQLKSGDIRRDTSLGFGKRLATRQDLFPHIYAGNHNCTASNIVVRAATMTGYRAESGNSTEWDRVVASNKSADVPNHAVGDPDRPYSVRGGTGRLPCWAGPRPHGQATICSARVVRTLGRSQADTRLMSAKQPKPSPDSTTSVRPTGAAESTRHAGRPILQECPPLP